MAKKLLLIHSPFPKVRRQKAEEVFRNHISALIGGYLTVFGVQGSKFRVPCCKSAFICVYLRLIKRVPGFD